MNYGRLFRTVKHLKLKQVVYQVRNRLIKPAFKAYDSSSFEINASGFRTAPIVKYTCLTGNLFTFLNLSHEFSGWDFTENGMLWAYNQNYFDWINQECLSEDEGCRWIDLFVEELRGNSIGLDPYPIALRSINWVKFFCRYPESATKKRLDSLYSQLRLLEKKIEYHLLANHLLEDAYALFIGSAFFRDERLLKKAYLLLLDQLKEQILPDGAHYEQSVMYHCILLDRLLDCINIGECYLINDAKLREYAIRMLGHLESVVWSDGSIPMLNDAAEKIAPKPMELFDYAKRLGLKWEAVPLKECGYRMLKDEQLEAIVDVGNVTAVYQPGHTHADTFNFELRIDGRPFVVDTGISTYNKTQRRQLERSTVAHNTVSVEETDSSEVWGGFRLGKRARVFGLLEERNSVEASHGGFKRPCYRKFELKKGALYIVDKYDGEAVSYIHLAEGVDENHIIFEGEKKVEIQPWLYSTTYNQFHEGRVLKVFFKGQLRYTIR